MNSKNIRIGLFSLRLFLVFIFLVSLSSCLLPEVFTCNVTINANGSYSVSLIGSVVDSDALEAISVQAFNENDYKENDIEQLKLLYGLKEATYINNGRFNVVLDAYSDNGDQINIFTLMSLGMNDGSIFVHITGSGDKSDTLKALGYRIAGTIRIVSEIPVKDSGGYEVERNGTTNVITVTLKELPKNDIVILFSDPITQNFKPSSRKTNNVKVSNDWIE